ncbi:MAG: SHOCT domain-containing protein [Pseudomonadota bacterium]
MHNWNSVDWAYGGGFIMGLGMLLIWLIPLGLLAALVMYLNNQNRTSKPPETAIELLEKTYARGEITRDEFLQKKEDLLNTKKLP